MPKICKICMNNDMLCQACNGKLSKGEIAPVEVEIVRALHKLEIEADFVRAVYDGFVYILADKRDARLLIGRGGRNSKKLELEMKKKVRIIENADEKEVIERVLGADIIGINIVYSPRQTRKIRVQRLFRHRVKPDSVKALGSLLDKEYEVVFE